MKMDYSIGTGYVSIQFDGKPSATIRQIMKGSRFRWSSASKEWWSRKVTGAADVIGAVQRQIDEESGIQKPDGPCWNCKKPDGYFRSYGAATPVYCDACEAEERARKRQPDGFDMAYEDDCARRCGLI